MTTNKALNSKFTLVVIHNNAESLLAAGTKSHCLQQLDNLSVHNDETRQYKIISKDGTTAYTVVPKKI